MCERQLSLVCFRYVGKDGERERSLAELNWLNEQLLELLNRDTTKGFIVSAKAAGFIYLRFVVCNHETTKERIKTFYDYICELIPEMEALKWVPEKKEEKNKENKLENEDGSKSVEKQDAEKPVQKQEQKSEKTVKKSSKGVWKFYPFY